MKIGYKGLYLFRDKDPIVDMLRTALEDSNEDAREIPKLGGPVMSTLNNLFDGDTISPQNRTVGAIAAFAGYDLVLQSRRTGRIIKKRVMEDGSSTGKSRIRFIKPAVRRAKKK